MKKTYTPTLFIADYFNGNENTYFTFVADKECDRIETFKKSYLIEFFEDDIYDIDDADILSVVPITEAYDYITEKHFKMELTNKQ